VVAGIAAAPFDSVSDAAWHDVPGASVSVQLASASPVSISWNFAIPVGGVVFSHVVVDGVALPGTQYFILQTGNMLGAYHVALSAGSHVISLQYKTNSSFSFDPSVEWETAALTAMVFEQ
jgi:hypothetical protein